MKRCNCDLHTDSQLCWDCNHRKAMKEESYSINRIHIIKTGKLTSVAHDAIRNLDESFVGTPNYFGVGWFWSSEYKHYLRGATYAQRVKVHKDMLELGLNPGDISDKHLEIVKKYCEIK